MPLFLKYWTVIILVFFVCLYLWIDIIGTMLNRPYHELASSRTIVIFFPLEGPTVNCGWERPVTGHWWWPHWGQSEHWASCEVASNQFSAKKSSSRIVLVLWYFNLLTSVGPGELKLNDPKIDMYLDDESLYSYFGQGPFLKRPAKIKTRLQMKIDKEKLIFLWRRGGEFLLCDFLKFNNCWR